MLLFCCSVVPLRVRGARRGDTGGKAAGTCRTRVHLLSAQNDCAEERLSLKLCSVAIFFFNRGIREDRQSHRSSPSTPRKNPPLYDIYDSINTSCSNTNISVRIIHQ